jgi:AcrR family transcriptional regulator
MAGSKRERTRAALLDAAQALLLERRPGALAIRDVAERAGVVPGTFYNYFESIQALVAAIGGLLTEEHGRLVFTLCAGTRDAAALFALTTRLTLRLACVPGYGHLLFDAGLPVDTFTAGLRQGLARDLARGARQGRFAVERPGLTAALTAGAVLGVAIDLHRGALKPAVIEPATARLLETLGVGAADAALLASAPAVFPAPRPIPLSSLDAGAGR